MSPALVVIIAIVVVTGMLLWFGALADGADTAPEVFTAAGRTKRSTLVFVGLTLVVGGVWYWAVIRPGLRRATGDTRQIRGF